MEEAGLLENRLWDLIATWRIFCGQEPKSQFACLNKLGPFLLRSPDFLVGYFIVHTCNCTSTCTWDLGIHPLSEWFRTCTIRLVTLASKAYKTGGMV